jgi:hypothetical protein
MKKNWRRYVVMGIALLMAVLMMAGLVLPYIFR